MISIEDVTDATSEQQKPDHLCCAHAAETAEPCEQQAASAVESPQTDANGEGEKQEVSGSSAEDTLVRGTLFKLLGLLQYPSMASRAECKLVEAVVLEITTWICAEACSRSREV